MSIPDVLRLDGCTCPQTCDSACKGECGCKVCHDAYQDFLSEDRE